MTLKFEGWSWKTIGHLFYVASSFVHHFVAIGELKLELQSGNTQFGLKLTIFLAMWPWNLTDDLEKQVGTSPKQHQALCIISSAYMNSNWSYSPEMAKLGKTSVTLTFDLWPLSCAWTSLLSLVVTPENFVVIWWQKHSEKGVTDERTEGRMDGQADRWTERGVLRAAWLQLKTQKNISWMINTNMTIDTMFLWLLILISKELSIQMITIPVPLWELTDRVQGCHKCNLSINIPQIVSWSPQSCADIHVGLA